MEAAVVGAGPAGLLHALSLRAHGARVSLVYDVIPARARNLASLLGAEDARSLEQVVASSARVITIASPPAVHAEQARSCAARERLVFLEKPVGVSSAELGLLAELPNVVPTLQWRAGRSLQIARSLVREGCLGPAPSYTVTLDLCRGDAYFRERSDARVWGCGALLSVGIHALDAVLELAPYAVHSVQAELLFRPGVEQETGAHVLVRFAQGSVLSFAVSMDAGLDAVRMCVNGAGAAVVIQGTEADPTCNGLSVFGPGAVTRRAAQLESKVLGHCASPLMVPFVGYAMASFARGVMPGAHSLYPSVASVRPAHALALEAYRVARHSNQ